MRTEMQQIYNEISEIVMTEKELSTVSKNWNSSCELEPHSWRDILDTTFCDNVCQ
jgi:hypothetical protein